MNSVSKLLKMNFPVNLIDLEIKKKFHHVNYKIVLMYKNFLNINKLIKK